MNLSGMFDVWTLLWSHFSRTSADGLQRCTKLERVFLRPCFFPRSVRSVVNVGGCGVVLSVLQVPLGFQPHAESSQLAFVIRNEVEGWINYCNIELVKIIVVCRWTVNRRSLSAGLCRGASAHSRLHFLHTLHFPHCTALRCYSRKLSGAPQQTAAGGR